MLAKVAAVTALVSAVSARVLQARQISNTTSVGSFVSSSSYVPPIASLSSTSSPLGSIASSIPVGLPTSSSVVVSTSIAPPSISVPSMFYNVSSSTSQTSLGTADTSTLAPTTVIVPSTATPPATTSVVTVYQPEIVVTVINQVTIVVYIYGSPVTTYISGQPYTFEPSPVTTVIEGQGITTVVVKPVSQTPVPTLTSTITLGTVTTTIEYVPTAAASTKSSSDLAAPSASTFQYTISGSICVCPIPNTVTEYITVATATVTQTLPGTSSSGSLPDSSSPGGGTGATTPPGSSNCTVAPESFPSLIIPVSQNSTKPFGTQYSAVVRPGQDVVFQWTVGNTGSYYVGLALPPNNASKAVWTLSGDAAFSLASLPHAIDQSLSYEEVPKDLTFFNFTALPGTTTAIGGSLDFAAGSTATFILRTQGDSRLSFFESQCPVVGLLLIEA